MRIGGIIVRAPRAVGIVPSRRAGLRCFTLAFAASAGCSPGVGVDGGQFGTATEGGAAGSGDPATRGATEAGTADDDGDPGPDPDPDPGTGDDGTVFDLPPGGDETGTTQPVDRCAVADDMNAVGTCEDSAPPLSFEPVVQWSFSMPGAVSSVVTPLVANLTDDNGDGAIDLCDIPDVVVVAGQHLAGNIFVLSGDDGSVHFEVPDLISGTATPAIGDIDDDGLPEIVTIDPDGIIAFEHDGSKKWHAPTTWTQAEFDTDQVWCGAAAIANLDNAGLPEVVFANRIVDGDGGSVRTLPEPAGLCAATVPVDLDDDGDLEVVLGHAAFHHDGTLLWNTGLSPGYPQVADLDGDGRPEVLLTNSSGLSLIEHDGTVTFSGLRPTGSPAEGTVWTRPATIHDFDGDGAPEFATSSRNEYTVYEADAAIVWSAPIADATGVAGGTAFDFLGDGVAEAMYADEVAMYVFDGEGAVLLEVPRESWTIAEYPVVADVDNDGSAEILVVSDHTIDAPALQVIADAEDRWIQPRRIWNQHAYHVTNVREDGTIPTFEPPHWESLNTFRTNAQIQDGGLCTPPPAG